MFFETGLNATYAQMVICPAADLKMILNGMKKALHVLDMLDPKDYVAKSFPVELGCAAIHQYFITTGQTFHNFMRARNSQGLHAIFDTLFAQCVQVSFRTDQFG